MPHQALPKVAGTMIFNRKQAVALKPFKIVEQEETLTSEEWVLRGNNEPEEEKGFEVAPRSSLLETLQ